MTADELYNLCFVLFVLAALSNGISLGFIQLNRWKVALPLLLFAAVFIIAGVLCAHERNVIMKVKEATPVVNTHETK